jgi:hypothetical protein
MPNSTRVRIKRGAPPSKRIKRRRERNALPELLRDFEGRCAYSMQHLDHAGGVGTMEIDHFDPRRKKDLIQDYQNLFLASRYCNNKKRDNWPTKTEEREGCRFLNPCAEMDYSEQIFEMPDSYRLVGITPAAQWHIRTCGLNADHLVHERALRAKYRRDLANTPIQITAADPAIVLQIVQNLRDEIEKMIPPIPAPTPAK